MKSTLKKGLIIGKNSIKLDKWLIENKTMQIEKLADQPIDIKETNEKNEQQKGYSKARMNIINKPN